MTRRLPAIWLLMASIVAQGVEAQDGGSSSGDFPFRAANDAASPRIAQFRADVAMTGVSAIEAFWNELEVSGAPLVERIPDDADHSLVTFVWRGSPEAKNVVVTDGVSIAVGGVDPLNSRMTRIDGTNVWYRSYIVRNDGRFTYALSENDPMALFSDPARMSNSTADPLNANRLPIIGQTYVSLPDAPIRSWVGQPAPENTGQVEMLERDGRSLRVYMPPGYRSTGEEYPLVLTMAGGFYADMVEVTSTLDHLIAEGRIPSVLAVVVSGTLDELPCVPEFEQFLADDLMPWMRQTYHATSDPKQTVIAGSSMGGLASACAAVNHPEVFGKVLSQSGSYWWNREYGSREEGDDFTNAELLTRQINSMDRVPVDFYIEVGLMEFEGQLDTNRRFRDALLANGYKVDYREFNGNHSYVNWRETFGEGLVSLLRN